jgi:hypothetical protein
LNEYGLVGFCGEGGFTNASNTVNQDAGWLGRIRAGELCK